MLNNFLSINYRVIGYSFQFSEVAVVTKLLCWIKHHQKSDHMACGKSSLTENHSFLKQLPIILMEKAEEWTELSWVQY